MGVTSVAGLEGQWRVSRRIEDMINGGLSHFSGKAAFERHAERWIYTEDGTLETNGQRLSGSRIYQFEDFEGGARVLFQGGRAFHQFSWNTPVGRHDCAPDLYHVVYRFAEWPRWHAAWHVSGPRKQYTLVSTYTRP